MVPLVPAQAGLQAVANTFSFRSAVVPPVADNTYPIFPALLTWDSRQLVLNTEDLFSFSLQKLFPRRPMRFAPGQMPPPPQHRVDVQRPSATAPSGMLSPRGQHLSNPSLVADPRVGSAPSHQPYPGQFQSQPYPGPIPYSPHAQQPPPAAAVPRLRAIPPVTPSPSALVGSAPWPGADDAVGHVHGGYNVVDDEVIVDSEEDDDDIVEEDPEEAQTLHAARIYGKKTPQQREELRSRLRRLNKEAGSEHIEELDLDLAVQRLREAAMSRSSVIQLAVGLQESLETLAGTRQRHMPGGSVHFHTTPDAKGTPSTTVGVMLGASDASGHITVQDLVPGSPAHIGGKILPGDRIVKVDGEPAASGNIFEKVKGSDMPGSSVTIQFVREGRKRPLEMTVLRAAKQSVDYTRKTFEMLQELALLAGADDHADVESTATALEKDLKKRLIAMEQERLQQELLLQEKDAKSVKILVAAKALLAEFVSLVAKQSGEDVNGPRTSPGPMTSPSTASGQLRELALQVGRASQVLEDRCKILSTNVSGKLTELDDRLRRVGDQFGSVQGQFSGKVVVEGSKSHDELETTLAAAHATMKLSEAASKLAQLQEHLAESDDNLRKSRQHNTELASQVETYELKISLLESKVQLQASQMTIGKHGRDPSATLSQEPGGPGGELSGESTNRYAAEIRRLKEELLKQKQMHEQDMEDRERSLVTLSSSLFATQDRESAGLSELVTLRMENLQLKEKVEIVLKEKNKSYEELETLYVQAQQKYVEASQELTRKTREITEHLQNSQEIERELEERKKTVESLQEMLRREREQFEDARCSLIVAKEKSDVATAQAKTCQESLNESERHRKALEERLDSSERLRKNIEETFHREQQEGLMAIRERNTLLRKVQALQSEVDAMEGAKNSESSQSGHDASVVADTGELTRQLQVQLDDKKREALQAQHERDGLKVEMDECRYVIGQLTAEVSDLRNKVGGMIAPLTSPQRPAPSPYMPSPNGQHPPTDQDSPGQMEGPTRRHVNQMSQLQHQPLNPSRSVSPKSRQPNEVPHLQELSRGPPTQPHQPPLEIVRGLISRGDHGGSITLERADSVYSSAPGAERGGYAGVFAAQKPQGYSVGPASPPTSQAPETPPVIEAGGESHMSPSSAAKPVGVYSNRAGRLFAM